MSEKSMFYFETNVSSSKPLFFNSFLSKTKLRFSIKIKKCVTVTNCRCIPGKYSPAKNPTCTNTRNLGKTFKELLDILST